VIVTTHTSQHNTPQHNATTPHRPQARRPPLEQRSATPRGRRLQRRCRRRWRQCRRNPARGTLIVCFFYLFLILFLPMCVFRMGVSPASPTAYAREKDRRTGRGAVNRINVGVFRYTHTHTHTHTHTQKVLFWDRCYLVMGLSSYSLRDFVDLSAWFHEAFHPVMTTLLQAPAGGNTPGAVSNEQTSTNDDAAPPPVLLRRLVWLVSCSVCDVPHSLRPALYPLLVRGSVCLCVCVRVRNIPSLLIKFFSPPPYMYTHTHPTHPIQAAALDPSNPRTDLVVALHAIDVRTHTYIYITTCSSHTQARRNSLFSSVQSKKRGTREPPTLLSATSIFPHIQTPNDTTDLYFSPHSHTFTYQTTPPPPPPPPTTTTTTTITTTMTIGAARPGERLRFLGEPPRAHAGAGPHPRELIPVRVLGDFVRGKRVGGREDREFDVSFGCCVLSSEARRRTPES
jgi:hypothetical protein